MFDGIKRAISMFFEEKATSTQKKILPFRRYLDIDGNERLASIDASSQGDFVRWIGDWQEMEIDDVDYFFDQVMNARRKAIAAKNNDYWWNNSVDSLCALAAEKGICTMVSASAAAIDAMQKNDLSDCGNEFFENELYKNREFAKDILDLAVSASDLDYVKDPESVRREKLQQLINGLIEMERGAS